MLRIFRRHIQTYIHNPQVYVHELANLNGFAYSLSPDPKAMVMGEKLGGTPHTIDPETFRSNGKFVDLINQVMTKEISNDFAFICEAGVNANAFMPIWDFREVPRFLRQPNPDLVFGYVHVDAQGKMVDGSFDSNGMYRVCNKDGLLKFSEYMYEKMKEAVDLTAQQNK